jgi:hypothetical protein
MERCADDDGRSFCIEELSGRQRARSRQKNVDGVLPRQAEEGLSDEGVPTRDDGMKAVVAKRMQDAALLDVELQQESDFLVAAQRA